MTDEEKLEELKKLLFEVDYPFFEDGHLESLLKDNEVLTVAYQLAKQKATMPEIRLGDVTIKPPNAFFVSLARQYEEQARSTGLLPEVKGKVVTRYDGR